MENDIERKAEELLAAVGTELSKSREKYADAVLEGEKIPLFAEEKHRKSYRKISLRRMLILAAVLIILMGLFVTSVTGVREKVLNLFSQKGEVSTELSSLENRQFEGQVPEIEPGYLPEGYELVSESNEGFLFSKLYVANERENIYLSVQESESFSVSVDNETTKQELTRVNVYQAQLFYRDGESYIVWQVGDYIIDIAGTVPKEEMMKIAESVCLAE